MKTLYKRIAHAIMAMVMLVSLTATVFAAEGYGFTTDDEPAEIYATILRDHGKKEADEYKRAVLIYTGTTDGIIFDVDDYELGPKDQYKASDLQNAINHVADLIDPATVETETTDTTETPNAGSNNNPDYASPEAQVFDDVVPGTWYYEAVNAMAAGGLLTGYTDGLFHPDDPITVAQYSTVFAKIYGIHSTEWDWNWAEVEWFSVEYDDTGKPYVRKHTGMTDDQGNPYPDSEIRVYRESMHWAQEDQLNISFMIGHHTSLPHEVFDTPIRRGQMLAEMVKLHSNKTQDTGPIAGRGEWTIDMIPDKDIVKSGPKGMLNDDCSNWKDYAANETWSWVHIINAYDKGITTGIDDNHTCNPYGIVTRAQFCQMLYNMDITTENSVTPISSGIF